ncbi:MAG: penicillin-binding protein activator, partial [Gammaproteobacteria bacterium]|nr:penicillin-binding protein activator [Gammaproteobacteria bacterium]
DPAARPALQLQAARAWLRAGRSADAARTLAGITGTLTPVQQIERRVIEADIEFANGRAQQAWQKMSAIAEPTGTPAAPQYLESRMRIALAAARPVDGVRAEMAAERLVTADADRSALRGELLSLLRAAREQGVKLEPEASQDPTVRGWLELGAVAGASGSASISSAAEASRWRSSYPGHPATELLSAALGAQLPMLTRLHRLALLLPVSGQAAGYAATIHAGFEYAWQQLPGETRPQVQLYDTGVLPVDQALRQARADGNDFIVGPLTRQEVDVAASAAPGVPMLALNFLTADRAAPNGMLQFALSPEDEAREIARRMLSSGQKRGVALSPTGDWGTRVLAAFTQELQAGGGELLAQAVYDPAEHDYAVPIRAVLGTDQSIARRQRLQALLGQKLEFEPRGRADLDFIFAPAQAAQARLLRPQLRFQYAGNVPVYATSDAYAADGGVANQDLDGLIVPAMPWLVPNSGAAAAVRSNVAAAAGDSIDWQSGLYAFGYDACQLAVAIAAAGNNPERVRVAGLTGELRLGPDGRVHREPAW